MNSISPAKDVFFNNMDEFMDNKLRLVADQISAKKTLVTHRNQNRAELKGLLCENEEITKEYNSLSNQNQLALIR